MARSGEIQYDPLFLERVQQDNEALWPINVYSVCHKLWQIEVLPIGYKEPPEAVRVAETDRDVALVTLRIADRLVWLDEHQVNGLINALANAREIAKRVTLEDEGNATLGDE